MPLSPKEIWLILHTKLRESLVKSPKFLDHLPNVELSPTLPNKSKDLLMESTMFFIPMPLLPREIWLILPTKSRESLVRSQKSWDHLPNVVPSPTLPNRSKDLLMESTMSSTLMPLLPREIWLMLPIKLRESLVRSQKSWVHLPNVVPSPTLPNRSKDLLMESTMSSTQMPQSPRGIWLMLPTKL